MKTSTLSRISILQMLTLACAASITSVVRGEPSWESAPRLSIYSEGSWKEEQPTITMQNQFKLHLARLSVDNKERVSAYVGLNWDSELVKTDLTSLQATTFSPLLGVRARPFAVVPAWFFVEHRRPFSADKPLNGDSRWESDSRPGAFAYDEWELKRLSRRMGIFSEAYGEAVASTLTTANLFTSMWSRIGLRAHLSRKFTADAFGNLQLKKATTRAPGDNLAQMGPFARIRYQTGSTGAALSAGPAFTVYRNWAWSGLLVLSAEL